MSFIIVDGLDGCGKHTQTTMLCDYLKSLGKKVLFLDYPVYGSKGCTMVEAYLHGELSDKAEGVNAYAASLFYAMDRYYDMKCGVLSKLDDTYDYVIADRYTISSAIFQAAKMKPEKRKDFCDWLFHTEYDLLGLPKPDVCVYLMLDNTVAQQLMTKRYKGDESKKDLHEGDRAFMQRCYEAGIWAAKEYNWRMLDCTTDDRTDIKGKDEVQADLRKLISDYIV